MSFRRVYWRLLWSVGALCLREWTNGARDGHGPYDDHIAPAVVRLNPIDRDGEIVGRWRGRADGPRS